MNDVSRIPFSELGKVIAGQHIPAEQYNGDESGTPYLTGPADFTERTPVVTKWTNHPRSFAESGDVLLTVKGAGCGKSNLGLDAAIGRQLMALRPNKAKLDRNYLFAFIRSQEERICALGQGATVPGIAKGDIEKLQIPYFPLPEQHRIADILDKADAIRRKREEGIRLTEELLRSTFLEMFGDPVKNQNGWEAASIGSLCRLVRGSSPRPKGDPRYYNGPVKRLMVEDLTRDGLEVFAKIDSLTEEGAKLSRPVPSGTIVLVVSGNVGLPAKLMEDACIHDGFVGLLDLDTSKVRPDYLLHTLLLIRVLHERNKAGAIWQNLTTDQVKATEVPLPSLNDQDRFLAVVTQHRKLAAARKQQVEQVEQLFCSLVQRAFRGEL